MTTTKRGMPEADRFWSYVDRSAGNSACWPWTGAVCKDGYGKFWMNDGSRNGRTIRSHRYAIGALHLGDVKNNVAKHSCDNPVCCNPQHISLGTQAENQKDKVVRGNSLIGDRHHSAKLTNGQAYEIKQAAKRGDRLSVVATKFGISMSHAWLVINRTWKFLDQGAETQ